MNANIVVIGSLNLDLVVRVDRHPQPGETLLGQDYATYPGGKGANQAVAAARIGGAVKMVGLVGEDDVGTQLKANLERNGVDATHVEAISGSSGIALITVDAQGQNTIVVSPGANAQLTPDRLSPTLLHEAALILLQLEIPLATVEWAIVTAQAAGVPVMGSVLDRNRITLPQLHRSSTLPLFAFSSFSRRANILWQSFLHH